MNTHASAVHIVDVSPHGLEGDPGLTIVIDSLGDIKHVLIAIATLVEAEAPVRLHGRQTNYLGVLLRHLNRAWTRHEIEIQNPAQGVVLQILTRLCSLVDHHIHAVGVQKEDAMCSGRPVLEIDGVVAVEISTVRNPIGILGPQSTDIVCGVESKRI